MDRRRFTQLLGMAGLPMSGGFTDRVIGGLDTLIRRAIKSPNYIAGSSGWSINKDGTAEFNNVTIRGELVSSGAVALLVYNGVPAAGNLLMAISAAAGVDAFGNNFAKGLSLEGDAVSGFLQFMRNDGSVQGTIYDNGPGNGIVLQTPGGQSLILSTPGGGVLWNNSKNIANGSGPIGGYYARDMTWVQNLPTGALTQINGFTTVQEDTDYGSSWAAGVFTAPVDSFYDAAFLLLPNNIVAATQGITIIRKNGNNVAVDNTPNPGRGSSCSVSGLWLANGDQLTFLAEQVGVAGPPSCSGNAQVARRL